MDSLHTIKKSNALRPFLYIIRRIFPRFLISAASRLRHVWLKATGQWNTAGSWCDQFPWCSPNTWSRIVEVYVTSDNPTVFEYGTGISTLHHLRELFTVGGKYIGVEHSPDWYSRVVQEVLSYCVKCGFRTRVDVNPIEPTRGHHHRARMETVFTVTVKGKDTVCCIRLCPPNTPQYDGDGSYEEFRDYVDALEERSTVVVVDGRARNECVFHAIRSGLINTGGLLVLFEAWRGIEGWMGHRALTGTSDYQPAVREMLALGGELVDGLGVDRWPGQVGRRSASSTSMTYPLEACFLRVIR